MSGFSPRLGLPLVLLLALLLGCGAARTTPDASLETAQAFLTARTAGDSDTIHGLLTDSARKALPKADLARYLSRERFRAGPPGRPVARGAGWVQVAVPDVLILRGEEEIRWPEVRITLRHDGTRWRVAWAEPLFEQALLAYGRSAYTHQLELGKVISEIDPYHYRGYLEQHFALRGLKRFSEAEVWLGRAAEYAHPPEQPSVLDARARFQLSLGNAPEALASARQALDRAAVFVPELYSRRWQADTLVVLARAQLAAGDRAGADRSAAEAAAIDPQNSTLAIFRCEQANRPAATPAAPTAPATPAPGARPGLTPP